MWSNARMSQYLISVWHAPGVHAAGTASPEGAQLGGFWIVEAPDEAAARTLAGEASYACGQPVELRRLQG